MVNGQHLAEQPIGEILGIVDRHSSESEKGANLCTIPLPAAPSQVVLRKRLPRDLELRSRVVESGRRDLRAVIWKPAFNLEELQQDGEAQSTSLCAFGQQIELVMAQGPVVGELLLIPVSFHATLPPFFLLWNDGRW